MKNPTRSLKYLFILFILIAVTLFFYFRPKTLWDRLDLGGFDKEGIAYAGLADISQGHNENWSGPVEELLGPSNELFGDLFHKVSLSGPVLYKKAAINPDLVNLYLSLPKKDGTHEKRTLELILSYGEIPDKYSAFINLDKKGYFVTSGKSILASFIQKAKDLQID